MFGKIEDVQFLGVSAGLIVPALAVCVAAATDFLWGKIFNGLTLPLFLLGVAWGFWTGGFSALSNSLLGVALVVALFAPMYAFGMMGAGDVKLLMGVSAWLSWRGSLHLVVLAILVGGVISACLLVLKGRFGVFFLKIRRFFLSVFVRELEVEFPKIDRTQTFPFGIAIAISTVWTLLSDPVKRWGIFPWD